MGSLVSAVIVNLYMEVFEEQATESVPYKPNIWKGYVDDTFAIMSAFLDTSVTRQPYSPYHQPYDSHHPQSVSRYC